MVISMGGQTDDGDVVQSVVSFGIESRITRASLTQDMIEDLQFFDFLGRAQLLGAAGELERCQRVAADPPDLLVKLAAVPQLGVELTSLSSTDVSKQRLDEVRGIERALNEKLLSLPDKCPHLKGRYVCIFENYGDNKRPPKRRGSAFDKFIDQFMTVLGQDFGVVDPTPMMNYVGPDGKVPGHITMKGRKFFEEYFLEVKAADDPNARPTVRANCQIDISHKDLRERLIKTVNNKDRPQNNFLLITTGLPDKSGYAAIGDMFVAHIVEELAKSGLGLQPKHLDQIIFHYWRGDAIALYDRPGAATLVDTSIWPPLRAPNVAPA